MGDTSMTARLTRTATKLGRDVDRDFRVDTVAIGLCVLHDAQAQRAGRPQLLDLGRADEDLAAAAGLCWLELAWQHPTLFPPTDEVPFDPRHVRAVVELLVDRDALIDGPTDLIAQLFTCAAPMVGKQRQLGAFYTPPAVASAMVAMTAAAAGTPLWETSLHEPTVGAGTIVVAMWWRVAAEVRAALDAGTLHADDAAKVVADWASRVEAVDIDPDAAWCAASQIAVRTGTAGKVWVGNTLAEQDTWRAAVHPTLPTPDGDRIEAFRAGFVRDLRVATLLGAVRQLPTGSDGPSRAR